MGLHHVYYHGIGEGVAGIHETATHLFLLHLHYHDLPLLHNRRIAAYQDMQDKEGVGRVVEAAGEDLHSPSDDEANRVEFEAVGFVAVVSPAEDTPPAAFAVDDNIDKVAAFVAFPPSWKLTETVDALEGLWGMEVACWHYDSPS